MIMKGTIPEMLKKWTMSFVFSLTFISILLLLVNCSDSERFCKYKEIIRKTSSNQLVDAVIIEKGCGATTSNAYHVFLSPKGKQTDELDPIFVSDKTDNIKISWVGSKELLITYSKARIFQFTNFWHSAELDKFNYIVSVIELKKNP